MKLPNSKYCRNCNHAFAEDSKYCSQCSQKNTDGKVPVWEFIKEFFINLLDIDSKLFLTFFALFIPGKLTVKYFKGKHKSYASPVRMFLFAGITLFAVVIAKTKDIDFGTDNEYFSKRAEQLKMKKVIKEKIKKYQLEFQDTSEYHQSDSLSKWIYQGFGEGVSDSDSIRLNHFFASQKSIRLSTQEFATLSIDSILTKYKVQPGFDSLLMSQQIKSMKDGKGLFHFFIGRLPIMIFFMMPFLALILKVLYVRHSHYFVEHLVFSFHYHTFAFVVTLILVLFGAYCHGLLIAFLILLIFIYQFMAMRRFYKQGFIITIFKWLFLNFSYVFLVIFFFVMAVSISFVLF